MEQAHWHQLSNEQLSTSLEVDPKQGLSEEQIA
ncbi:cation-transporting P-type ATPase, partial [Paenibacillus polymyxa]